MAAAAQTSPRLDTVASPTSTSSYDLLTSRSSSESYDEVSSDDEIVYSVPSSIANSQQLHSPQDSDQSWVVYTSDDEVVDRGVTPAAASRRRHTANEEMTLALSRLSLNRSPSESGSIHTVESVDAAVISERTNASADDDDDSPNSDAAKDGCPPSNSSRISSSKKRRSRRRRRAAASQTRSGSSESESSSESVSPPPTPKKGRSKRGGVKAKDQMPSRKKSEMTAAGLGQRGVVDDISEKGDECILSSAYDEAAEYITSFLSNPTAADKLTLLQAFIIELGLYAAASNVSSVSTRSPSPSFYSLPDLPRSLKQAKALLKSRVFMNIRDYLAVREQGPAALQGVMHPSRRSLMQDLRVSRRSRAPLGWVKQTGLTVFLVECYH